MAATYSREVFTPTYGNWIRDALRQGTISPQPTYFDEDKARRMFLYELAPEQIEGLYPNEEEQPSRLRDLLDPRRRMREAGLE